MTVHNLSKGFHSKYAYKQACRRGNILYEGLSINIPNNLLEAVPAKYKLHKFIILFGND